MSQLLREVKEGQVNEKSSLPKVIARGSRCSAQFSLCLSRNTKESVGYEFRGHSSVGRAPALQAGCQEFESPNLH